MMKYGFKAWVSNRLDSIRKLLGSKNLKGAYKGLQLRDCFLFHGMHLMPMSSMNWQKIQKLVHFVDGNLAKTLKTPVFLQTCCPG